MGVNLPTSEHHDLQLMAQRDTAARWSRTVTVYRTSSADEDPHRPRRPADPDRAKPPLTPATRTWPADNSGYPMTERHLGANRVSRRGLSRDGLSPRPRSGHPGRFGAT